MSNSAITPKEILTKAKTLLSNKDHWLKGELYNADPVHNDTPDLLPKACILGALYWAAGHMEVQSGLWDTKHWRVTSDALSYDSMIYKATEEELEAQWEDYRRRYVLNPTDEDKALIQAARIVASCIKARPDGDSYSSIPEFNDLGYEDENEDGTPVEATTHEDIMQVMECAVAKA